LPHPGRLWLAWSSLAITRLTLHTNGRDLSNQDDDYPFVLNADDPGMGKSASRSWQLCFWRCSVVLIAPKTVADDTWCSKNGEIRRCLPDADIVRGLDKTLTASRSSPHFLLRFAP